MGIGKASGQNRAREAAEMAVRSPLLELAISEAKGAVFNVCGGSDLSLGDVTAASEVTATVRPPLRPRSSLTPPSPPPLTAHSGCATAPAPTALR